MLKYLIVTIVIMLIVFAGVYVSIQHVINRELELDRTCQLNPNEIKQMSFNVSFYKGTFNIQNNKPLSGTSAFAVLVITANYTSQVMSSLKANFTLATFNNLTNSRDYLGSVLFNPHSNSLFSINTWISSVTFGGISIGEYNALLINFSDRINNVTMNIVICY